MYLSTGGSAEALRKAGMADASDGAVWERHYRHYRVQEDQDYKALVDYVESECT